MNISAPISTIISQNIYVVAYDDYVSFVKNIFERKQMSNVLVMCEGKVVGIINKLDFNHFYRYLNKRFNNQSLADSMLNIYTAEDIMSTEFSVLEPDDSIRVALELLKDNIFTVLPVIDRGRFVGVISANQIIGKLLNENIFDLHNFQSSNSQSEKPRLYRSSSR